MSFSQIQKLYLSNFLTGLVFWYGIEKLFMRSIGIDAVGVGTVTAALTIFLVLFDIPAGILADKWSRKGVLVVSALALAMASLLTGLSHGILIYLVGDLFFGLYIVTSGGTYQAIIYDSLSEEGRASQYSKINGQIYAFFLVGTGVGNVASGFLAHAYGYKASYLLSIIPCLINAVVILSLHEPRFHKSLHKEQILRQVGRASIAISRIKLVRSLTVVLTLFTVIELFKLEFGQLYFLRYITTPQTIGILWAVYSFSMALGSLIAHRFSTRLNILLVCSVVPFVLMSFIDNRLSIVLFMIQAVATAALLNQIETRIQNQTPSAVRASVLSVVSTFGRAVAVPASFILGWIFKEYNGLIAVRFIAIVGCSALLYWLIASKTIPKANQPIKV